MPVIDKEAGQSFEYRKLRKHPKYQNILNTSYSNKLGWLRQKVGKVNNVPHNQRVRGTDTFKVIRYAEIPMDRRKETTYTKVVCELPPHKADPHCMCITIGGKRICYPGDVRTLTGSLEMIKPIINKVVLKTVYGSLSLTSYTSTWTHPWSILNMRASIYQIPRSISLNTTYTWEGWVYFEIIRGCYGLPQAGKSANDILRVCINKHGYYEATTTPGLWRHKWRPILFGLIVDGFGIEYVGEHHYHHLLHTLQEHYTITTD